MSDFDKDIKERKSLVPSARRRKNGVKSKKCTLPMDYMTKKEIESMNGELASINLNKPYTWAEFEKFPDSLKQEYIRHLRGKYGITTVMLADMLGMSISFANRLMRSLGFKVSANNSRATKAQRAAFNEFIGGANDKVAPVNDEIEEAVTDAVQPEHGRAKAKFVSPLSATLTYSGNVRAVCEALVYALGADSVGDFEITFKKEAYEP